MNLKKRKDNGFLFSKFQKNLPAVFVSILVLDQVSKFVAVRLLPFVCNSGVAFGLPGGGFIFSILVLGTILGLMYFENSKKNVLALALVFCGGVSNFVDRVFFGCVRDFIDFGIFPAFNFADIAITVGVGLLIINLMNKNDEA